MSNKNFVRIALCVALAWGVALGYPRAGTAAQPTEQAPAELAPQPEGDIPAQPELADEAAASADGCDTCGDVCFECLVGPPGRYWLRADYLLWWTRGSRVPPLVTTSTDPDDGGVIGRPTTSILFGGQRIDGGSRSNARLSGGMWFDCGRTGGIEFDVFSLGEAETTYSFSSPGDPLLARPFYDTLLGEENAELVSHPDYLKGRTDGRLKEYFHGGGVAMRLNMCCEEMCCTDVCEEVACDCGRAGIYAAYLRAMFRAHLQPERYRVDLIAGYRTYRLNESLRITENLETTGQVPGHPEILPGTTIDIEDYFRTQNEFHGAELGVVAQFYRGPWSLELLGKLGIGNNNQVVTINGHTTTHHARRRRGRFHGRASRVVEQYRQLRPG